MHINGSYHVHGPQPINTPHRAATAPAAGTASSTRGADQLDISPEAELLSRMRDIPDVRIDRVLQIRAAIESGQYETADKLDKALDRLLDEIG